MLRYIEHINLHKLKYYNWNKNVAAYRQIMYNQMKKNVLYNYYQLCRRIHNIMIIVLPYIISRIMWTYYLIQIHQLLTNIVFYMVYYNRFVGNKLLFLNWIFLITNGNLITWKMWNMLFYVYYLITNLNFGYWFLTLCYFHSIWEHKKNCLHSFHLDFKLF